MSEEPVAKVADDVAELAVDGRFAGRASEFEQLANDLRDPEGDTWAGVDLFAAFPPESTISVHHSNIGERIVGVLAAVSVFLPVGWTWLEFRRASAAYEDLIAEGGEPEGRTFLGLWASGFDGRLGPSSHLASVAMVSVALIAFAIACLVVHRLVAESNVRREERQFQSARADLLTVLTAAALVLNRRRADHPDRIEGIIKSSMDKLRQSQDAARQAAAELAETSKQVNDGVKDLLDSAQEARGLSEALLTQANSVHERLEAAASRTQEVLGASIEGMDTTIRASLESTRSTVDATVSALEETVRESITASQASVATSTSELSGQLRSALSQFERALGEHLDGLTSQAVSAITQSGESLGGIVGQIEGSARTNASAANALAEQVALMRDDQEAARTDLSHALGDVRAALEAIESMLLRHEGTLQGQTSELSGARDAAERMLRQLTASAAGTGANGYSAPRGS